MDSAKFIDISGGIICFAPPNDFYQFPTSTQYKNNKIKRLIVDAENLELFFQTTDQTMGTLLAELVLQFRQWVPLPPKLLKVIGQTQIAMHCLHTIFPKNASLTDTTRLKKRLEAYEKEIPLSALLESGLHRCLERSILTMHALHRRNCNVSLAAGWVIEQSPVPHVWLVFSVPDDDRVLWLDPSMKTMVDKVSYPNVGILSKQNWERLCDNNYNRSGQKIIVPNLFNVNKPMCYGFSPDKTFRIELRSDYLQRVVV